MGAIWFNGNPVCARLVLFVWAARQARSKGGFQSARALKALASPPALRPSTARTKAVATPTHPHPTCFWRCRGRTVGPKRYPLKSNRETPRSPGHSDWFQGAGAGVTARPQVSGLGDVKAQIPTQGAPRRYHAPHALPERAQAKTLREVFSEASRPGGK